MYASSAWPIIHTCIPFIPALGVPVVFTTVISIDIFACGARMRHLPLTLLVYYSTVGGSNPHPLWWGTKTPVLGYSALGVRMPLWSMVQSLFSSATFPGGPDRWRTEEPDHLGLAQPRCDFSHPFGPMRSTCPEQVHLGEPPLHWEFLDIKVKVSLIYLVIYLFNLSRIR